MWFKEGWNKIGKIIEEPSRIFLIPPSPISDATSAASEAVSNVAEVVDAQTAASAVASTGETLTALPVPGFITSIMNTFMDIFFYTSDGGYTVLAEIFQIGMVLAEITFGALLMLGLFTAFSSIATIGMGVMIWTSGMAPYEMLWYASAGIATIGGSGSVFGLDYYVLPWLKTQWKRIPLVRRWYLFTD